MDIKGYKIFRQKLEQLLYVINECKHGTGGADNGPTIIPKDTLKRLIDKSEEWLDLSEEINDQIKDKKQLLVKANSRRYEDTRI